MDMSKHWERWRPRRPGEMQSAVSAGLASAYMVLGVVTLVALTAAIAIVVGMGN